MLTDHVLVFRKGEGWPAGVRLALLALFTGLSNVATGFYPTWTTWAVGTVSGTLLLVVAGSLGKVVYRSFCVLYVLLLALQVSVRHYYGELDANLLLAMRFTTGAEVSGYLRSLLSWGTVLLALLAGSALLFLLFRSRVALRSPWVVAACAAVVLTPPTYRLSTRVLDFKGGYTDPRSILDDFPSKFVSGVVYRTQKVDELLATSDSYTRPYDWAATFPAFDPRATNIVVIGESSRADMYGPNGQALHRLTPNIDSTYNVNFDRCFSPAPQTLNSLMRVLFLTDTAGDYIPEANIVSLVKSKHARTWWLSNQAVVGKFDSPLAALALLCDSSLVANEANWMEEVRSDSVLLPAIHRAFAAVRKQDGPSCIFIHLFGQHPLIPTRALQAAGPPVKSTTVASYMESVRVTDLILGEVITAMRKLPDANLFYFSDHGMIYRSDGDFFIHNDRHLQGYQVPFMVWQSGDAERRHVARTLSLRDFIRIFTAFNSKDPAEPGSTINDLDTLPRIWGYGNKEQRFGKLEPNLVPR